MNALLILPAGEMYRVTPQNPRVPDRAMLRFSLLGLTTLAAATPEEWAVRIVDENVQPLTFDTPVDVVGVSFMTGLAPRAFEIAEEYRRRGAVTVAGGYHPTLMPDQTAEHFDVVVVGEGEDLWPRVLADVKAGRARRIYRSDSPPSLAGRALPRRDLMDAAPGKYATTSAVQVGRGCAHRCRYCSVTAFHGGQYRARPAAEVIAELRQLPRNLMFVDDNLFADREVALELMRRMAPLGKRWVTQGSLEIADDPQLLRAARKAGCRGLFVGIETTSAANLGAVGKDFNDPARYAQRISRLRRAGIAVQAGMIVGMDGDGVDVFQRTLRFLQRTRIDALQLAILTPLPGTPLFDEFDRQGRVLSRDWSRYDFRHVVIQPARMSAGQLQDGADWLYRQFYRLDRILLRFLRTLWTCGPIPAAVLLKVNLTYRYDNRREGIIGQNPADRSRRNLIGRARKTLGSLVDDAMDLAWRSLRAITARR
jgi:radical SAM superfamily enzyme YgiQ (UPF0313 family)